MNSNIVILLVSMVISFIVIAILDINQVDSKYRNITLLLISFSFYLFIDYKFALLLIIQTIIVYCFGKKIRESKIFLFISIFLVIVMFGFFKYYNFFINSINVIFGLKENTPLSLAMPIGISFYSLKSISYLVDVYRGDCNIESNYCLVALYISYFPEIISGPISSPSKLIDQFKQNSRISYKRISEGIQIMAIGFFKKIVLADNLSVFVNEVYRAPNIYSSITVILCVISYALELYLDFSGYSDIIFGFSKMLGIDIEINFNQPYLSYSLTEFWNRWHISLSTWLKKYVYIPLGGNRKGKILLYFNLLLTMIISGIWHGTGITFIIWGAIHGLGLIIDKIINNKKSVLTLILVDVFMILTWIIFKSSSIENMIDIYHKIFIFSKGINYFSSWAIISLLISVVFFIFCYRKNERNNYYPLQDLTTYKGLVLFFVFVGTIIGFAYTGASPFIYSSF